MPKIALVKTSSLGDVVHNLPVVSDILFNYPDAEIHWVVEEAFAEIPAMHPGVRRVFPVAVRRWRKAPFSRQNRLEIRSFRDAVREESYDLVIDSQGLLKSALITRCFHGTRCGFDRQSCREPLASFFYDVTRPVEKNLHAVERNRLLAARCLGYDLSSPLDYGLSAKTESRNPYAVFLHATSRDDKLWSEENWIQLGRELSARGFEIHLPWGSEKEKERSARLAAALPRAVVCDKMNLRAAAELLGGAKIAIGVDTGLSHLAAAVKTPIVGIYCSTDPGLTGILSAASGVNLGGKERPPAVPEVLSAAEKLAR